MGIFSFLFKKKKVDNHETEVVVVNKESNKITMVSIPKEIEKDHKDISDFLVCYEDYKRFINQDDYISVKNIKKYCQTVSDKLQYLKKLDQSNLLKDMCKATPYDTVIKYINEIENINLNVEKHNEAFIEKKKVNLSNI